MTEATHYQAPSDGWRTFLIVWTTQSISVFGSALTNFAITIWLTTSAYPLESQKSQLAWALSIWGLSFAIPTVFGAPIAGAFVDRHDRKQTMILMDLGNGILSLMIMTLIALHRFNIYWLIFIGAVAAILTTFHSAAFDTSYAMIVPEEKLPRANGMMQTIFALSGVLSPAVAAALIAIPALARQGRLPDFLLFLGAIKEGAILAIGIDALTFFIAAFAPLFLFIPSPKRTDLRTQTGEKKSIWADVREGALYIWYRRSFLWLLGTFAVANFVDGTVMVLGTLIVRFQLQPDWAARGYTMESALALLTSMLSVGGVLFGVLVSVWGGLKSKRVYGVMIPLFLSGLMVMVIGGSRWLYLSVAAIFVLGGTTPLLNAHSQTIWQSQTPRELQGRVFSVRRLIAQFSWPASTFLAGALASQFDLSVVTIVLGAVLAGWCVISMFNPALIRVEDKEWIEAQAARYLAADRARAAETVEPGD